MAALPFNRIESAPRADLCCALAPSAPRRRSRARRGLRPDPTSSFSSATTSAGATPALRQRRGAHTEHRPAGPVGAPGPLRLRHLAPVQPLANQHPLRDGTRTPPAPRTCTRRSRQGAPAAVVPPGAGLLHRAHGEDPLRAARREAVPMVLGDDRRLRCRTSSTPRATGRSSSGSGSTSRIARMTRCRLPGATHRPRVTAPALPGRHPGDPDGPRPLLRRDRQDGQRDRRDGGGARAAGTAGQHASRLPQRQRRALPPGEGHPLRLGHPHSADLLLATR